MGRLHGVRKLALTVLCVLVFASAGLAEQPAFSEYQVKAAFLYNFAKFIGWPEKAFVGAEEPIIVGVLGEDPFGEILEEILAGKTVGGRSLSIKRFSRLANLERCHLLFVAESEAARTAEILARVGRAPTLTVGDGAGFAEHGGMIGFVIEERRVRFDINLNAIQDASLKPSSQLLKVARTVVREPALRTGEGR